MPLRVGEDEGREELDTRGDFVAEVEAEGEGDTVESRVALFEKRGENDMEGEVDGLLDVLEVFVPRGDTERVGAGGAVNKSRVLFWALGDTEREGEPLIEGVTVVVAELEGLVETEVEGVDDQVAAVVGKGKHSGPRPIPAIPELAPNPVKVLS